LGGSPEIGLTNSAAYCHHRRTRRATHKSFARLRRRQSPGCPAALLR
jgi:hypothetical protein